VTSAHNADGSGAVHVTRDGVDVIAHYGSVAAEIAVCTKAAGLIERPDLEQVRLSGRELFVDHALAAAIADGVPAPGEARCVAGVWACRPAAARAVLAGPPRPIERWRAVMRRAVATTAITIELESPPRAEAVSIIGPRAQAVVEAAGLPAGVATGSVAEGRLGGAPVDLVLEECDRYLLLFADGCSDDAWRQLGMAGRPLGLAHVGQSALDHLRASRTR
jgi:hypothetical protein